MKYAFVCEWKGSKIADELLVHLTSTNFATIKKSLIKVDENFIAIVECLISQ